MNRTLSGAIWGLVLGVAVAVVLQQQGIWPLDKITVFLLPGAIGLIVIVITRIGRSGGTATLVVAVVITGAATAYGATGIGDINQFGRLEGGCTVTATSAVDSISSPADTSRSRPFVIDPQGGLSWRATSPSVFDDYPWEIWVELGGSAVPIDGELSQNNDAGDTENSGNVANAEEYGESRGIPVSQLRGVFMVGGFASVCDGFGFVTLEAELLETIIAKVAAAIALLALIMVIRAIIVGRSAAAAAAAAGGGGGAPGTELDDIGGASASAGDANLDGEVDAGDFTSFGSSGLPDPGTPGDYDGDGDIDTADYTNFRDSTGDGDGGYEPGSEDLPDRDDLA